MSHNINIVDGVASYAFNAEGGKPWHGLGTEVQGLMTSAEALQKANLDFQVNKVPLVARYQDAFIDVPSRFGVMRMDTQQIIGTVGKRYELLQNRDSFTFFDSIVGAGEAVYESVGALGLGERIFILAKLPTDIKVSEKDNINSYLLLYNSHDGTSTIRCRFTPVRVVCQNTLNIAMRGKETEISIRHTESAAGKLAQAHKLLGIVARQIQDVTEVYKRMADKYMATEAVKSYLDKVFPINPASKVTTRRDNILDDVKTLFVKGKGNNGNTLWDLYNGVTEYVDHVRVVKGEDEGASRWEASTFGSGAKIKEVAFATASELVAVA